MLRVAVVDVVDVASALAVAPHVAVVPAGIAVGERVEPIGVAGKALGFALAERDGIVVELAIEVVVGTY